MTVRNKKTGLLGETLAAAWLEEQGFTVLKRNWRWSRYEIDLIAHRAEILHFIEVKTRRSSRYGYPEESVTEKKFSHILEGAARYTETHPEWKRVQYDIVSIILKENQPPDFYLVEDVYL
jgi:putative endonuclease